MRADVRVQGSGAVALETAVLTHGLPCPFHLQAALQMEEAVRSVGATPATIALLKGVPTVGLTREELSQLAGQHEAHKIARHNLTLAIALGWTGGTTVSATLLIAHHAAKIPILATGGIGGVHRGGRHDVSADLLTLAQTPMLVVCSGAKAILDLPATREMLETLGIPVVGYCTDEMPGFYTPHTGLPVDAVVRTPDEAAMLWQRHCAAGVGSGMLLVQPPPAELALNTGELETMLQQATVEAEQRGIQGGELTPWLLHRLGELSDGRTLQVNLALLAENARLAGHIAHLSCP
ncbi:MAG: pseudouridine-5'-phosphate glycosidase [Fimbriimonadales bacterium]|nr:pseudouridine-5'-phosphate glycosidase [Fimbriimonadales bacterium]